MIGKIEFQGMPRWYPVYKHVVLLYKRENFSENYDMKKKKMKSSFLIKYVKRVTLNIVKIFLKTLVATCLVTVSKKEIYLAFLKSSVYEDLY